MAQITARLSPTIRDRFDRYASEVGLDASELARLLITREMRIRRLAPQVKDTDRTPSTKRAARKLTAHFHEDENVAEFDRYVRRQGFKQRADAARQIVEQELNEKWLARAFAWNPTQDGLCK